MPIDPKKSTPQVYSLKESNGKLTYGAQVMFGSKDIITVGELKNPHVEERDVLLQDGSTKKINVFVEPWGEFTFYYALPEDVSTHDED